MSDTSLVEDECEEQASQLLEERRGDGNEQDDQKNVTAVHLNQLFYRGTVGKSQVVFSSFPKNLNHIKFDVQPQIVETVEATVAGIPATNLLEADWMTGPQQHQ